MRKNSQKLTPALVLKIKGLLKTKQYFQHQIAAMFDVNQGRISEVKNGHWDWLIKTH